jgi:transporter family protein
MPAWLLFSLANLLMVGANGFVAKWTLRTVPWPALMVSTTVAYGMIVTYAGFRGLVHLPTITWPVGLAIVGVGLLTAGSFLAMVLALERADASQVVPVSAGYPLVTLLLGFLFLSEPITVPRLAGASMVVAGVILISR